MYVLPLPRGTNTLARLNRRRFSSPFTRQPYRIDTIARCQGSGTNPVPAMSP